MRLPSANLIIGLLIGFATLSAIVACPHAAVEKVKREVHRRVKRQKAADPAGAPEVVDPPGAAAEVGPPDDPALEAETEKRLPIGDVANPGPNSTVGQSIYNQLMGTELTQSSASIPAEKWPKDCTNSTDPCCVWYLISKVLTVMFRDPKGGCNDDARAAVRLGFHDAGTWNTSYTYGGADGSFLINGEWVRPENKGLEDIARKMITVSDTYGVGKADLVQFAAKHATVTCPLGPRIRAYIGRIDCPKGREAPDGLLPDVHAPADYLVELFENKTIYGHMLAALVGAHSTSRQFNVDTTRAGEPQDSTPSVWDVRFYYETLLTSPPCGVFKFPSDVVLSTHPKVITEWNKFINDQDHWNEDFANSYLRLSLLSVYNINYLTECTTALPPKIG